MCLKSAVYDGRRSGDKDKNPADGSSQKPEIRQAKRNKKPPGRSDEDNGWKNSGIVSRILYPASSIFL